MEKTASLKLVVVMGAALVGCLLMLLAASESAKAAFPGENGTIVYASDDGYGYQIYTVPPSGGTPTKVSNGTMHNRFPDYSPDNTKIAFSGFDGTSFEIFTIAVNEETASGSATKVTNGPAYDGHPVFSPDSTTIAYESNPEDKTSDPQQIFTIPASGGTPTQVTNMSGGAYNPSYSPDGTTIAFSGYDGSDYEIFTIPVSGGTVTQLTNNTTGDWEPDYSPNGTNIAYQGQGYGVSAIFTIPVSGGTPTQVTNNMPSVYAPAYSPDGTKIAYWSQDETDYEIYTIPVSGGTPTQVTSNTAYDEAPDWGRTPDATPPETSIDSGPDGPTSDNTPTFSFSGLDSVSAAANLVFSYKVDEGDWSEYSSQTTVTLGGETGLSDGPHTFSVKAKDEGGNEDQSPAERAFEVDTTTPTVTSVKPTNSKTKVQRGINITATFSEEMNPDTLNDSTVFLINTRTGGAVAAQVSCEDPCTTVTLNPWTRMAKNTKYKAIITNEAEDLIGHSMVKNKTWTFTTGAR